MATPKAVAEWMLEELNREGCLYQNTAASDIESKFGEGATYINEHGNLAIDRRVLTEFRAITGDDVVWERTERAWRKRESHDEPGRKQY